MFKLQARVPDLAQARDAAQFRKCRRRAGISSGILRSARRGDSRPILESYLNLPTGCKVASDLPSVGKRVRGAAGAWTMPE